MQPAATMKLPLAALIRDSRIQPRESVNAAVVSEYAEAMAKMPAIREAGLEVAEFPAILAFSERHGDGTVYWLADGWHRVLAAEQAGWDDILAEVREGGVYDAIMAAAGSNGHHGLRRTNRDKHRAVRMLLEHPAVIAGQWSDGRIAVQAVVSTSLVRIVRHEREVELGLAPSPSRVGTDGKSYSLPSRSGSDASQTSQESREAVQSAPTGSDAASGSNRALVVPCAQCEAILTEPSWHCASCGVHWPLDLYPDGSACPQCAGEAAPVPSEPIARVVDSPPQPSGLRAVPQAQYTPGVLRAGEAAHGFERLARALDLIESLDGLDAADLAAYAQDPSAFRARLTRARDWLLRISATSLGVRAL